MKHHLLKSVFLAASLLTLWPTAEAAQYTSWQHSGSMFILTTPEGADLPATASEDNFPLLVRLNKDNFDFRKAKPNGEDIRFSTSDGTPMGYQIEEWDAAAGTASIWVRIPTIKGNARQEFKMFWGKPDAASESNGAAVFDTANGFAGVWHLHDVNSIADATIRQNTGTNNGATNVGGIVGRAASFVSASGQYISLPTGSLDGITGTMTISLWTYGTPPASKMSGWTFGASTASSDELITVHFGASDLWWAFGDNNPRWSVDKFLSPGKLEDMIGQWRHWTFTHDLKSKMMRIYRDGVLYDSYKTVWKSLGVPGIVKIGRVDIRSCCGGGYDGYVDELQISKTERSAMWIKLSYENQKKFQTLVGSLVQTGNEFSVSQKKITVLEGKIALVSAKAGGAQKVYWILKKDGLESVAAVDTFKFLIDAGRITGDQTFTVQCKAVFADKVKTLEIPVTIQETIPDPVFTLKAPAKWNGRETIEIVSQLSNLKDMQQKNVGELKYDWKISGMAVIKEIQPGKLILTRSQSSGKLDVTLTISNGGKLINQTASIEVTEPKSDPWLARIPAKDEKPEDGQFYPRDDKGLGTLYYNGTLTAAADTAFLKLYANDKLIKTETAKPAADKSYTLSTQLKPGLIQYKVEFGTKAGGKETVLQTVNDLVCGDAYIIDGQSNALATDTAEQSLPETNKWIRSYGRPSDDKTAAPVNLWCYPVWKAQKGEKAELGWWGMELAKRLVESQKVPIFIINAAAGGTRIDQHLPNPQNRRDTSGAHAWANPYKLYGTLLTRVEGAKLTHGIRGILWHQGENDQSYVGPTGAYSWETYQELFVEMAAEWKTDFPNVKNYYVFQIFPNSCAMGGNMGLGDRLREKQRTLPYLFSNMSILSTLGVKPPGGCHYPLEGWAEFARMVQPIIERDHYGAKPTKPITAANLRKATYTTKDTIALEFDQPVVWADALAGQFYLDGEKDKVASGSVTGNVLTLKLKEASAAKHITYLKETNWNQNTLLLGENGIAALTFCEVPLQSGAVSR